MSYPRLAWALILAAATFMNPSWSLAPPGKRVSFAKHGSDWVQGNCGSRAKQSPIDLNEIYKPPGREFQYKYTDVPWGDVMKINNDGRMIDATLINTSIGVLGGVALDISGDLAWFNISSINIKSVSEHTIRGKHYPLEIQIVHRPANYYPQSGGPSSVTVSILVDCQNPPESKQVYPGLLQTDAKHATRSKLRGKALLEERSDSDQMPEEVYPGIADISIICTTRTTRG
jgi:hypothetical protein